MGIIIIIIIIIFLLQIWRLCAIFSKELSFLGFAAPVSFNLFATWRHFGSKKKITHVAGVLFRLRSWWFGNWVRGTRIAEQIVILDLRWVRQRILVD
jgi:hypothetical protein